MLISNQNNPSISSDPEWDYLGDCALSEFAADVDHPGEVLNEAENRLVGGLGIPGECLNNIATTLARFARNARVDLDRGRTEPPVTIRIFCQKKADAGTQGGWGYFLIERGGGFPPGEPVGHCKGIDLYLYNEGK